MTNAAGLREAKVMETSMATLVLVHEAWHDGRGFWEIVSPQLHARRHQAFTPDLLGMDGEVFKPSSGHDGAVGKLGVDLVQAQSRQVGGIADSAGFGPGVEITAINGRECTPDLLRYTPENPH